MRPHEHKPSIRAMSMFLTIGLTDRWTDRGIDGSNRQGDRRVDDRTGGISGPNNLPYRRAKLKNSQMAKMSHIILSSLQMVKNNKTGI